MRYTCSKLHAYGFFANMIWKKIVQIFYKTKGNSNLEKRNGIRQFIVVVDSHLKIKSLGTILEMVVYFRYLWAVDMIFMVMLYSQPWW